MPIPPYDELLLPVLRHCAEKTWSMRELIAHISDELGLNQEEREQLIPSGTASVIANRVHWAKTYLKQAGLLEQPKRAVVQISARGKELLDKNPPKIDAALLQQFEDFRAFLGRTKSHDANTPAPTQPSIVSQDSAPSSTPEEQITAAADALDTALRDALMTRILEGSPGFFERLIIDLL